MVCWMVGVAVTFGKYYLLHPSKLKVLEEWLNLGKVGGLEVMIFSLTILLSFLPEYILLVKLLRFVLATHSYECLLSLSDIL